MSLLQLFGVTYQTLNISKYTNINHPLEQVDD